MEEVNKRLDKIEEHLEEYVRDYVREFMTETKQVIFSELIGHLLEKYKEKEVGGLANYNKVFDVSGNEIAGNTPAQEGDISPLPPFTRVRERSS